MKLELVALHVALALLSSSATALTLPRASPRAPAPRASAAAPLSPAQLQALPGDPSLILHVSVSLGDGKKELMKAASKAIASSLSKPESYVSVCVYDDADIIWAGEDTPCALGILCSIGAINQENNAALTAAVSELLKPHGVPSDRIYINFFDIPRANCGWSGRTFAG